MIQFMYVKKLKFLVPLSIRMTWTDCEEAGDYVVPNELSPRDLVSRPDNMDETVLHKKTIFLAFCHI